MDLASLCEFTLNGEIQSRSTTLSYRLSKLTCKMHVTFQRIQPLAPQNTHSSAHAAFHQQICIRTEHRHVLFADRSSVNLSDVDVHMKKNTPINWGERCRKPLKTQ